MLRSSRAHWLHSLLVLLRAQHPNRRPQPSLHSQHEPDHKRRPVRHRMPLALPLPLRGLVEVHHARLSFRFLNRTSRLIRMPSKPSMHRVILSRAEDIALFWARKAKSLGDPAADSIEQQVFDKQIAAVQGAIQAPRLQRCKRPSFAAYTLLSRSPRTSANSQHNSARRTEIQPSIRTTTAAGRPGSADKPFSISPSACDRVRR